MVLAAILKRKKRYWKKEYEALPPEAQREYKYWNWRSVFELTYMDNGWVHRGDSMQATFGELRKENIRKAWFFTSVAIRPENLIES